MSDSSAHAAAAPGEPSVPIGDVPTPPSHEQHRALRHHRLKLALVTSVLLRPLSLIVPIVTVPLFLRMLGTARFGLMESVSALAIWISLSNGGMGLSLLIRLMDCHVSGDQALARRYVSTLFVAMLVVCGVGTLVLSGIVPLVDWGRLFSVTDPGVARELTVSVWVAGLLALGGLVLQTPQVVYSAYQEIHRNNLWDAACKLATLGACFWVARFPSTGLVGALFAFSGVWLIVRLANSVWLLAIEKPWLFPRFSLFEWKLLRVLMVEGVLLFILQTAIVAIYQSDKIIIGVLLGPEQVAAYAVLGRFYVAAYGIFMLLLTPLWPAHGEAVRRGDLHWVRRAVTLSSILGCGGLLLCGAGLLLFGDRLFLFWTHDPSIRVSPSLILAMTTAFALRAWVDSRSTVLNAAARLFPQVWFFSAHVALNLLLAVILGKLWGVEGVGWAMAISGLFTTTWGYPWMMHRYVYGPARYQAGAISTLS